MTATQNVDCPAFMRVARALAFGESGAMRAYCRAGKILIPHGSTPMFDQALSIVSDRRKLTEFENHLLRKTNPQRAVRTEP